MADPFEEIAFLAGSENRFRVLEELLDAPASRDELRVAIGVSKPTIGRILEDLDAKNWITQSDRTYETTSIGELVVKAFTQLLRTMAARDELLEILEWLPLGDGSLELADFSDAKVTLPTPGDPFSLARPIVELIDSGQRVTSLTSIVTPPSLEASWRAVTAGDQEFELVLADEALSAIETDETMRSHFRELVQADRASAYVYDGDIPYAMGLVDGTVQIAICDDVGVFRALIETDNDRVRRWLVSRFEAYRTEARPLTPDRLVEP